MATTSYIRDRWKAMLKDLRAAKNETMKWFQDAVRVVTGNQRAAKDRERLMAMRNMSPKLVGRMIMYYYDPKHKDTLPYYDRFPLVFPISFGRGYFIGINVHYLPHDLRVRFFEALMDRYNDRHLDERTRLNISYDLLKRMSQMWMIKPAVKKYLYSHMKSKVYVVNPEDWALTLMLPTEKFVKRSKEFVWKESRQKVKGY